MDQITRNPRVIGIHLDRVTAHLGEAFRELLRVDPEAFPPDVLKAVILLTSQAWADALLLAETPVIPVEKPAKAPKAPKAEAAK